MIELIKIYYKIEQKEKLKIVIVEKGNKKLEYSLEYNVKY